MRLPAAEEMQVGHGVPGGPGRRQLQDPGGANAPWSRRARQAEINDEDKPAPRSKAKTADSLDRQVAGPPGARVHGTTHTVGHGQGHPSDATSPSRSPPSTGLPAPPNKRSHASSSNNGTHTHPPDHGRAIGRPVRPLPAGSRPSSRAGPTPWQRRRPLRGHGERILPRSDRLTRRNAHCAIRTQSAPGTCGSSYHNYPLVDRRLPLGDNRAAHLTGDDPATIHRLDGPRHQVRSMMTRQSPRQSPGRPKTPVPARRCPPPSERRSCACQRSRSLTEDRSNWPLPG